MRRRLQLVEPTVSLHAAFVAAWREWGPGLHEDGFGIRPEDELVSSDGFERFVRRVSDEQAARSAGVCRWIVEDGRVLGGVALRYRGDLEQLGHIGFGVRPSARGRGVASWALGQVIGLAASVGLDRVLLVCADDNTASARTIERAGGVLDPVSPAGVRRYWIETNPSTHR